MAEKTPTDAGRYVESAKRLGFDPKWKPPKTDYGPAPLEPDEREMLESFEWYQKAKAKSKDESW